MKTLTKYVRTHAPAFFALVALVLAMGGTWTTAASAAPTVSPATAQVGKAGSSADEADAARPPKKPPSGKININTATEEQLMLLPTVGPAKAERIVTWRKKNGGFKRVADIRRVKGFGYKTFKRLEPLLDIKGDTTLAQR
jgi:competence ComEA-like helix-hairpin-helix protein